MSLRHFKKRLTETKNAFVEWLGQKRGPKMKIIGLSLLIAKWLRSRSGGPYIPTYIYDDNEVLITDDLDNAIEAR